MNVLSSGRADAPFPSFAMRAVELHGHRIWERGAIKRTLAFMTSHRLDTLVLHESDIVHEIVYPRAYFDPYALWTKMPSRRGENAIFNNRAYMRDLLSLAKSAGVKVILNVKEISFSDEVLSIRPELFKAGAICPSEPFWEDYIAAKTEELFTDFPELAGLIVSFGSQESRASRVQNRCGCDLCATESLEHWYGRMISALHAPAARHGKSLAIRDFAYNPSDHAPLISAMRQAPADVVFCIKAMPHDFYITFPDNPALGACEREQWVEYDVMGQFAGWGEMPCFLYEDLRARMPRWHDQGASGVIFRIEWERLNDLYSFDNLSEINLLAAALLAGGEDNGPAAVCARWLADRKLDSAGADWLASILLRTPAIVSGAAYTAGFVTADNSMLPRSIERAWWGAEVRDSLSSWDPSRAAALDLDPQKYAAYRDEKRAARFAADGLCAEIASPQETVSEPLRAFIAEAFAYFAVWVEGLELGTLVCLEARWIGSGQAAGPAEMQRLIAELEGYAARVRAITADPAVSHHVAMLIDWRRALDVVRGARSILSEHASASAP